MNTPDDIELCADVDRTESSAEFSREFLQTVVDAFPDSLVVIDRNYQVLLANRTARAHSGTLEVNSQPRKCFQYFHHRESPCSSDAETPAAVTYDECPIRRVFDTKMPVRVYHTHYDKNGRETSVAVDAAPVVDKSGEVALVIESCRDVTERTLSRRLLRIGNRHMEMQPLLEEYVSEIRNYTGCSQVAIHVLDEECDDCPGARFEFGRVVDPGEVAQCEDAVQCVCMRFSSPGIKEQLPPPTPGGSLCFGHYSEFLSRLPDAGGEQLGACLWPECESIALIPIRFGDLNLGMLHVADARRDAISVEMLASLERLSLELATAIHRVRIEETLHATRNELEERVTARTAELMEANEALQDEITKRGRLEREILQVSVKEQQRIGQELHDGLGQELTGLSYLAQNLLLTLKAKESPEVEMATELARNIPAALGQIQNIVRGLVPLEIGAADLEIALDVLTSNVAKLTGTACRYHAAGRVRMRDDDAAIQIYRIAQEAVTNAVKHARAMTIDVTLAMVGDEVRLEVRDDGIGIGADAELGPGCGLRSMNYRARAIGGECHVQQGPSGGTVVTCVVPQGFTRACRLGGCER